MSIHPMSWVEQVKELVRRRYARLVETDAFLPGGAERARQAGYPQSRLNELPQRVASSYCGCGYVLEEVDLSGVRVVVDLGCGAGLDAYLVARDLVGGGMVVALDLTPPMLNRVRQVADALPDLSVHPVAGDMEQLPLKGGAVDLVLANASFNLTLDKHAAFAEAVRILRPGGRLVARELIRGGELPAEIAQDPMAWNASLGGVLEEEALCDVAGASGFAHVRISHHYPFPPVVAVRLEAVKPA